MKNVYLKILRKILKKNIHYLFLFFLFILFLLIIVLFYFLFNNIYDDNEGNNNKTDNNSKFQNVHSESEDKCKYVCSNGIIKSCDVRRKVPQSSSGSLEDYNFEDIKKGSLVYVCTPAIRNFVNYIDKIDVSFVLISGDADESVWYDIFNNEEDFKKFIENDKIIKWYAQNCVIKHPKIVKNPIGLDYHSSSISSEMNNDTPLQKERLIEEIKKNSKPFHKRKIMAYSNFHFSMNTRHAYDRREAKEKIPEKLVYYEPTKTNTRQNYSNQSEYAFVISPHGNGYDCHRTWEALIMGCIPIVKTSGLDSLYDELPVLIVNDWSDVNEELLKKTISKYRNMHFNYDKLTLKYWVNKYRSSKSDEDKSWFSIFNWNT
jgi:hypothetical protein